MVVMLPLLFSVESFVLGRILESSPNVDVSYHCDLDNYPIALVRAQDLDNDEQEFSPQGLSVRSTYYQEYFDDSINGLVSLGWIMKPSHRNSSIFCQHKYGSRIKNYRRYTLTSDYLLV